MRATRLVGVPALLALTAIFIGSFQKFYLEMYRANVPALHAQFTELPYRRMPGLRRLYLDVAQRTPPGARILILIPKMPRGAYVYAFSRAHYPLAGRVLVPVVDPATEAVLPRVEPAEYIVCWRGCAAPPGFAAIWSSADGALLRRSR